MVQITLLLFPLCLLQITNPTRNRRSLLHVTVVNNISEKVVKKKISTHKKQPPCVLALFKSIEVSFEFIITKQDYFKRVFFPPHELSMSVEIQIFEKSIKNRPVPMALIKDNDWNLLFSPVIFQESLKHFEESCGNSLVLFQYNVEEIRKRKTYLNTIVKDVPTTVNIKNTDNYIGLMTYY